MTRRSKTFAALSWGLILITTGLLFWLIPGKERLLERSLADLDFPRMEKQLQDAADRNRANNPALYRLAALRLALHKDFAETGRRFDREQTLRSGSAFLPFLEQSEFTRPAAEAVARVIALSDSPEAAVELVRKIPGSSTKRQVVGDAVKAAFAGVGNPAVAAMMFQEFSTGSPADALESARLWRLADNVPAAARVLESWFDSHAPPLTPESAEMARLLLDLWKEDNNNSDVVNFLLKHLEALEEVLGGEFVLDRLVAAALASGEVRKAAGPIRAWLEKHPEDSALWLKLSDLALASGDPILAASALDRYVELNPGDDARELQSARAFEWAGEPGRAFDIYLHLAKNGSKPAADRLLALYPGLFRGRELIDVLPAFLPEHGTSTELMTLAGLLVEERDYDGARKLYRQHLKAVPDDLAIILELAELDMQDEIFDEARELYSKANALDPGNPSIEYKLVRLDWLEGHFDNVVEPLGRLAHRTMDPDIIQKYYTAAESLGEWEALTDAMELEIATEKEPRAEHYRNLAYYHTLLDRPDKARDAIRRARNIFKDSTYFRAELAYRLSSEGKSDEALRELDGIVEKDSPADLQAFYVDLLTLNGRKSEAFDFLRDVMAAESSTDPDILELLGSLYEDSGRLAQAETLYRRAASLDPSNSKLRMNLARILGTQGRHRQMDAIIGTLDLDATPLLRREVAQLYMDAEDYPRASSLLEQFLATPEGRKDSLAWRMLGDCTLSSGDPVNAKRAYRKALALLKHSPAGGQSL